MDVVFTKVFAGTSEKQEESRLNSQNECKAMIQTGEQDSWCGKLLKSKVLEKQQNNIAKLFHASYKMFGLRKSTLAR